MISSKTLNIDNPRLNCRLKGLENFSPKRIILDKDLEINLNTYILRSTKKNNTIIFHNSLNKPKISVLKKKGIILYKIKLDKKKIRFKDCFKKIVFFRHKKFTGRRW